jgi:hypothetical protein
MSNVPDGMTRVEKRSSPYEKTSEVDSKRAGEATIDETPRSWTGRNRMSETKSVSVVTAWRGPQTSWATHFVLVREDSLWVDADDRIVGDEHLLALKSRRRSMRTARVEQSARNRVHLVLVVRDCSTKRICQHQACARSEPDRQDFTDDLL